jgi:putative peptidoglycan lipid II flippase
MILLNPLITLFAPGFENVRRELFGSFFAIQAASLIFQRAVTLNNELINAHMRFMLPYLLGAVAQCINIAGLFLVGQGMGIHVVAMTTVVGTVFALIAQFVFIHRRLGIRVGFRLRHDRMWDLIRGSFPLRLGHQVWGLRDLVTTNVLSRFPIGTVSIFSYAWKLSSVLFTVTNSPLLQIFQSRVARLISEGRRVEVRGLRREVMRKNALLFIAILIPTAAALPFALHRLLSGAIPEGDLRAIFTLFAAVVPIHLLMSLEMPYVHVMVALKRSEVILKIAFISIFLYLAGVLCLFGGLGVFSIPVALAGTHGVNLLIRALAEKSYLMESVPCAQTEPKQ